MTLYSPTDVTSVMIPVERGGCGQPHEGPAGERFGVDCAACEPVIAAMRTGWAATPAGVHLTPDEIAEAESAEAAATRAQHRTWGDPNVLGEAIRTAMGAPTAGPSLLEQIAALGPHERAALAAMLTADGPAATASEVSVPDEADTPTARKPGRPRKAAEAGDPEPPAAA